MIRFADILPRLLAVEVSYKLMQRVDISDDKVEVISSDIVVQSALGSAVFREMGDKELPIHLRYYASKEDEATARLLREITHQESIIAKRKEADYD